MTINLKKYQKVELISPIGNSEIIPINLQIKNAKGKDIGDFSGNICDVYQIITYIKLEKGNYIIQMKNTFSSAYLPNVLGVGVIIEKS